jgi:flagellar motility protein MotE (MotC chaperone)
LKLKEGKLSNKTIYVRMEQEIAEATAKIKAEYKPLLNETREPNKAYYFNQDQMGCLIDSVLNEYTTKKAYRKVREKYSLSQSQVEKAYKRKSIFFKDILESKLSHPALVLLKKHNLLSKWWIKAYYEESVSTGLARISRNIQVALRLEAVEHLKKQNNDLTQTIKSLEAKLKIKSKDWFHDIALPMSKEGYSIADIRDKTGQSQSTIRQRLHRYKKAQSVTCHTNKK